MNDVSFVEYREFNKVFDFIKANTEFMEQVSISSKTMESDFKSMGLTIKTIEQKITEVQVGIDRVEDRLVKIEAFLQLDKTTH